MCIETDALFIQRFGDNQCLYEFQSFSVDFFYQLFWRDHRFISKDNQTITLGPQWKDRLWMPDTYFRNSVQGGVAKLFTENFYFRITDRNTVFMAARIQMKLNCDMNFIKFPFDQQKCYINITTCKSKHMDGQYSLSGISGGNQA